MRALNVPAVGEHERLSDLPVPTVTAGSVLVRVTAAGLNVVDNFVAVGMLGGQWPRAFPVVLGRDAAGVVAAVGPGVTRIRVGDEVVGTVPLAPPIQAGTLAEYALMPAEAVAVKPAGLDFVSAAALPFAGALATAAVDAVRPRPGQTVLVNGASGGVGSYAIQLAAARGAQVFTTAGSAAKLEACRRLGADVLIDYKNEVFEQRVRDETGGAGVDVVLDNMGAAYLARNLTALATGGRLIVLGLQGGTKGELDLGALLSKRATVHSAGLRGRPTVQKAAIVAETQAHVWPLIEDGTVRPVVDRVLTLDEAAEAHRVVEASEHVGKVLMRAR